ncbi:MAG: hypothetical protein O7B25_07555 [Gammaproteobacteria bacterium]|nr:hypothetical protein [Gammaproteobacteria bacterium]
MRIIIIGLLLCSYATASDQRMDSFVTQLETHRTNAVAQSCRASLPASPAEKAYYNADGVLLEARDYCMFLAIQYVRQYPNTPTSMLTADNTTPDTAR